MQPLARIANLSSVRVGVENHEAGNVSWIVRIILRDLFPRKTWARVVELLHVSPRVAKHRLAGTREFTAGELAGLLRSEFGQRFLIAVMADAEPAWWRRLRSQLQITDARHYERLARRKIKEAVQHADDTVAALSRAETALCLQDEEFYGPQFSLVREVTGVQDSAMAPTAKAKVDSPR